MKKESMQFKFRAVSIDRFEIVLETLVSGKLFDMILEKSIAQLPQEKKESLIKEDIKNFSIPPEYLPALRGKVTSFVKDIQKQLKAHNKVIMNWDVSTATFSKFESEKKNGGAVWYINILVVGVYA